MSHASDDQTIGADAALARMMEGNARFLRGESRHLGDPKKILANLANFAEGQRPYATILGCSDSRVPPELVFDAGFGELFIIRVAGNIYSPEVMGSIQYAGIHLQTKLFMVLGHEVCGAVEAALAAKFMGATERSHIQRLLQDILPGLDAIDPGLSPQQQLSIAVEANVRWSMQQILAAAENRAWVEERQVKLVGAIYETTTGRVRLLDPAAT